MPIPTLSYYIQKARHRFNYKFAVQVMKYRKTKVCNRRSRDVEFTGKKKKKREGDEYHRSVCLSLTLPQAQQSIVLFL